MDHQQKLYNLVEHARKTKKTCMTVLPNLIGEGYAIWTAKPKDDGSVEITHKLNRGKTHSHRASLLVIDDFELRTAKKMDGYVIRSIKAYGFSDKIDDYKIGVDPSNDIRNPMVKIKSDNMHTSPLPLVVNQKNIRTVFGKITKLLKKKKLW
jgi:hypothetical protein